MRVKLLIDSNIYLRFYDSNRPELKSLLRTFPAISQYVAMTSQIRDEVERNKIQVFLNSFDVNIKNFKDVEKIQVPEHINQANIKDIKAWNINSAQLNQKFKEHKKALADVYKKLFDEIIMSKDDVSQIMSNLYENIIPITDTDINLAKRRKLLGNPPGKFTDPLGDQVNWEVLLRSCKNFDKLIFVSLDNDYFVKINSEVHFNPLLTSELKVKNPKLVVSCHDNLSEAIKELKKDIGAKIINDVIDDDKLNEVMAVEKSLKEAEIKLYDEKSMNAELLRIKYLLSQNLINPYSAMQSLRKLGFDESDAIYLLSN